MTAADVATPIFDDLLAEAGLEWLAEDDPPSPEPGSTTRPVP